MATKKTKYYEVKVPVKPYIKKFITKTYGGLIHVDSSTPLGFVFNRVLTKNTYESRHPHSNYESVFEQDIKLRINDWQFRAIGFEVSTEHIYSIHSYLDALFIDALYLYCDLNVREGTRYKGYKEAIYGFCADYKIDLEDDIQYYTICRKELRYRNKRNEQKNNV